MPTDVLGRERRHDAPRTAEVMSVGPRRSAPWLRWTVLFVVLALTAPLVKIAVYEATRPPRDLTLAQLQDAYYGMVRSDGTNDMSTINPTSFSSDTAASVSPALCAPLFDSTMANRFPPDAVDGVSAYWLSDLGATTGLFTLRYPSTESAATAYALVSGAAEQCGRSGVKFPNEDDKSGASSLDGTVVPLTVTSRSGVDHQLAFMLDRQGAGPFGFQVMHLSNTLSWEFVYDPRAGRYDQQAAQQLMDGLASQLLYVQKLPRVARAAGGPTPGG